MEFYLVQDNCALDLILNRKQTATFHAKAPFTNAHLDATTSTPWGKFAQAAKEKFGDKSWPVIVTVFIPKSVGRVYSPFRRRGMVVKGEIFKGLQQFLNEDDPNEKLKIEVNIELVGDRTDLGVAQLPPLTGADFSPKMDANGMVNHSHYSLSRPVIAPFSLEDAAKLSKTVKCKVSIKISVENFLCVDHIFPKAEDRIRKIFQDKKLCDFTIISEDGTRVPCHKVFLSKSPVLLAMLEGDYQEARENEMKMGDMTTQGVDALLEYFYCDEVRKAMSSCDVALELLKAADKYDLPLLWTAISTIISAKAIAWFGVDMALKLFDFLSKRKREDSQILMEKSLKVLALKREQLSKSTLFNELFSSGTAKEMFAMALVTTCV